MRRSEAACIRARRPKQADVERRHALSVWCELVDNILEKHCWENAALVALWEEVHQFSSVSFRTGQMDRPGSQERRLEREGVDRFSWLWRNGYNWRKQASWWVNSASLKGEPVEEEKTTFWQIYYFIHHWTQPLPQCVEKNQSALLVMRNLQLAEFQVQYLISEKYGVALVLATASAISTLTLHFTLFFSSGASVWLNYLCLRWFSLVCLSILLEYF